MNEEFEEQLDKLFSDFKSKVNKLVSKNANKALKDQAKVLKDEFKFGSTPKRPQQQKEKEKVQKVSVKSRKRDEDEDDSDNSSDSE